VLWNLQISERLSDVQTNVIWGGFLEWESRSLWLDTIPEAIASANTNGNSEH
jgi:hypothetical protein